MDKTRLLGLAVAVIIGLATLATPNTARAAWLPDVINSFWWLQPTRSPLLLNALGGLAGSAKNATEAKTPATAPTTVPTKDKAVSEGQRLAPVALAKEPESPTKPRPIVAGWLTPWGDDSYRSFSANLDKITEVHPFVYTINPDGVTISESPDWRKGDILRLAKENKILVIPTIAGDVYHSDLMLNDAAKRAAHIDQIIALIETNNYDGFNIDYEGFLNGYNREVYATFMTELSAKLRPQGKIVAISVEAFNRLQDWETISAAVDRFMLMGYDYHAARGPEVGPIGPANWLAEVIDYTATRVAKEKIVLGLGTYGYSWIHNGSQYVSTAVGHADALAIASELGIAIQRDGETPWFSYNRGAGQRFLYFEDAISTRPKLDLARRTGIGGIAFWRLGVEDPAIWSDVAAVMR